jgi:hypothetical protein
MKDFFLFCWSFVLFFHIDPLHCSFVFSFILFITLSNFFLCIILSCGSFALLLLFVALLVLLWVCYVINGDASLLCSYYCCWFITLLLLVHCIARVVVGLSHSWCCLRFVVLLVLFVCCCWCVTLFGATLGASCCC